MQIEDLCELVDLSSRLSSTENLRANSVAILYAVFEHLPVLAYFDVALRAGQQQIAVVAKASVPGDYLFIAPARRVLLHFLVRHTVKVSAKIDAGFIKRFIGGFLFEVPNRLFHIKTPFRKKSVLSI